MPPLALTSLLRSALPRLSPGSRAVVSTLGCCNGHVSPIDVSQWLGYRTRYQLARLLRRDGLPPFEDLAAWTRVLYWLRQSESTGASLLQLVRRDGLDPASAYRLVHRVTGSRWSELQRAGLRGVVLRLQDRTRARAWLRASGGDSGEYSAPGAPCHVRGRRVSLGEEHAAGVSQGTSLVRRVSGRSILTTIVTGGGPREIGAEADGSIVVANEAGWVDIVR